MDKVYIVFEGCTDDWHIGAVYDDKDDALAQSNDINAQAQANHQGCEAYVEEWNVTPKGFRLVLEEPAPQKAPEDYTIKEAHDMCVARDYCGDIDASGTDCMFTHKNGGCILRGDTPEKWEIH